MRFESYFRNGIHHYNYRVCEEAVRRELEEDGGAQGSDPGTAQASRDAQEIGGTRRSGISSQWRIREFSSLRKIYLENHNIEVDLDLAGDLAQLKKNLAKLRKGKHGRGLGDILIEEIDWVGIIVIVLTVIILNFIFRYKMIERSKLSQ